MGKWNEITTRKVVKNYLQECKKVGKWKGILLRKVGKWKKKLQGKWKSESKYLQGKWKGIPPRNVGK